VGAVSSYVKSVGCLNRKLYYYDEKTLTQGMIDAAYHCPVDLIAHGVPHRVLPKINQEETKR
jgi:zinc transport system ATP-binding protein